MPLRVEMHIIHRRSTANEYATELIDTICSVFKNDIKMPGVRTNRVHQGQAHVKLSVEIRVVVLV